MKSELRRPPLLQASVNKPSVDAASVTKWHDIRWERKTREYREMQRSAELRNALLRFHELFSTEDLEGFARILAQEEAEGVLVIGPDPGEWVEG